MDIYISLESDDIDEVAAPVGEALAAWVETQERNYQVDYHCVEEAPLSEWLVGLRFSVKNKKHLKAPLTFLEGLAKTHKADFVVGIYDESTQGREDICYFGHEEGRPDMFEIASYLEL